MKGSVHHCQISDNNQSIGWFPHPISICWHHSQEVVPDGPLQGFLCESTPGPFGVDSLFTSGYLIHLYNQIITPNLMRSWSAFCHGLGLLQGKGTPELSLNQWWSGTRPVTNYIPPLFNSFCCYICFTDGSKSSLCTYCQRNLYYRNLYCQWWLLFRGLA